MNMTQIAKALGKRGGLARARRLSAKQRKKIASKAGRIRWLSAKAADRIKENFGYLEVVYGLKKPPPVKSVSAIHHRLPAIYGR